MEAVQQTTRKLAALAAIILLCGVAPQHLSSRFAPPRQRASSRGVSPESLLPSSLGKFHIVNRSAFSRKGNLIENGAIYQDGESKHFAEISIHYGAHDGLSCYLIRGIPVRRQFVQSLATADSIVDFDIAFLTDESLMVEGRSTLLLLATTTCTARGCSENSAPRNGGLDLNLASFAGENALSSDAAVVPLSNYLGKPGISGRCMGWKRALEQLQGLLSNFRLLPLRGAYSQN